MQWFCVLNDGETFSGVEGSTICFYDNDENLSEDDLTLLENGELPDKPKFVVDLHALLTEAIEMKLKSVSELT